MYNQWPKLFLAPDPPVGGTPPVQTESLGLEDAIEFMGEDDDKETLDLKPTKTTEIPPTKTDDKEDDDEETETETEVDELAELEEELKPPTEEQLELVTPVRRREILKKYPELFKDFPYLEKAYYREQQFTELLPTIDDAREAVEKSKTLDQFESEIIGKGNTENILKAVKEENPDSFYRLVDDYLPTLARVDEKAYLHVLGNITIHTILAMVNEARTSKNDVLQSAAQILNQFVFGSSNWTPPQNLGKPATEVKPEVNAREQELLKSAFNNTLQDLNTRVNNTLKNTIDQHIDPKQSMTDYVRKNASKDALETLNNLIRRDTRFTALADKLWERAVSQNFSKDSTDDIKRAWLSKAKTLLPSVLKKARNEALRGMGKRVSDDSDDKTSNKGPMPTGRPRSQSSGGKNKEERDIPAGMKTLDFLNAD